MSSVRLVSHLSHMHINEYDAVLTMDIRQVRRWRKTPPGPHLFVRSARRTRWTSDTIRPMRRVLWNTIISLSVLLMVLTVAEWVRTDQDCWWASYGTPSVYWEVSSRAGHFRFARATGFSHPMGWQIHLESRDNIVPRFALFSPRKFHGLLGFSAASGGFGIGRFPSVRYLIFDIAYWGLLLVASLMPATSFIVTTARLRRLKRRLSQIQCTICGYDLRATQDRCPECGTVPSHLPQPGIANSSSV